MGFWWLFLKEIEWKEAINKKSSCNQKEADEKEILYLAAEKCKASILAVES